MEKQKIAVKPFVKWVGGKGQLKDKIIERFPKNFEKKIIKYAEPFVGGGAILFEVLSKFKIEEVYISDININLINTYKVIKDRVEELILNLEVIEEEYIQLDNEKRKEYFNLKRKMYNDLKINNSEELNLEKAVLFIFLNKTCFNGLYRVNKKGEYNVPVGSYKNPCICDKENLKLVSLLLKKVKINHGDYRESINFIDEKTLVYFDPPYRPLNDTSSFTSYTENIFDDNSQRELANYIETLSEKGAKVILSNSDPKNINEKDEFFDELYKNYYIERIKATRMINSKGNSRGKINELLITNFREEI